LFSITTLCPSRSPSLSPISRATLSARPPGSERDRDGDRLGWILLGDARPGCQQRRRPECHERHDAWIARDRHDIPSRLVLLDVGEISAPAPPIDKPMPGIRIYEMARSRRLGVKSSILEQHSGAA
jgi:hypothetical protein